MEYTEKKGIWRTISGRRVFIADGSDVYDAMAVSGKFKKLRKTPLRLNAKEYSHVMHELNTYYERFKGNRTVAKCIHDPWSEESFVYVFTNNGFDSYVIFDRLYIGKRPKSRRYIDGDE